MEDSRIRPKVDPEIAAAIQRMIDDAYTNGFHQGLVAARNCIDVLLHKPGGHVPLATQAKQTFGPNEALPPASSKPRGGTAKRAIQDVFERKNQPLGTSAVYREAIALGHKLSQEAIGATFRRYDGTLYQRDNQKRWSPIAKRTEDGADRKSSSIDDPPLSKQSSEEFASDARTHPAAYEAA